MTGQFLHYEWNYIHRYNLMYDNTGVKTKRFKIKHIDQGHKCLSSFIDILFYYIEHRDSRFIYTYQLTT